MQQDLLTALASGSNPAPVVIVAAHPDDEVIGAASRLPLLSRLTIVHVTDGAPRNMYDANRCGFGTREEYAAVRRAEFVEAMSLAGAAPECLELGVPDQEATFEAAQIASELARIFRDRRPGFVLTHPYEGGHPDHDATAFAVHHSAGSIPIVEFTSYHNRNGTIRTGEFLPGPQPVVTVTLDEGQQQMKRTMLDCFHTQAETLAQFDVATERFRLAPQYDFSRPPHEGTLYYERFDWGMTGERFRALTSGINVTC